MAANRYSQPQAPAFQNNYVSQYVPKPFEAMERLLSARQGIQDQYMSILNQELVETPAGWKADPVDAQFLQAKQAEIGQFVEQLAGQDLTQRENQQALQAKIAQVGSDKGIQAALTTAKNRAALQEQASKLQAEGKLHDNNGVWAAKAYQDYAASGGAAAGNVYGEQVLAPYVDVYDKARRYYADLTANGSDSIARLAAEGGSIAYKNGQLGITGSRIQGRTKEVFQDFLNSQEGKQVYNDAVAQGKEPLQYILQQMQSIGSGFAYNQSSTNLDTALNKGRDEKKKKEEEPTSIWADLGLVNTTADAPEFDEKGNLKKTTGAWEVAGAVYEEARKKGQNSLAALAYAGLGGIAHLVNIDGQAKTLEDKVNIKKTILEKAYELNKQINPQFANETMEEYYKRNDKKPDQLMPLITDGKLSSDLGKSMVESGYLRNALIFDMDGNRVNPSDIIKYDEKGKSESNVGVLTDPQRSFTTADANRAVIIQVDGNRYTVDLDGNAAVRGPSTLEEVDRHNQKMMQRAVRDKFVEGVYYDVDEKGKIEAIPVQYHFDASMRVPQMYPLTPGK